MAANIAKKKLILSGGETLKRLPRGFEAARDTAIAPYLLWKCLVVNRPLSKKELGSPDLVAQAVTFAKDCRPRPDYGWTVLERIAGGRIPAQRTKRNAL